MNDISDNSSNSLANGGGTVANTSIPKDGTGMSLLYPQFLVGIQVPANLVPEADTEMQVS